MKLPEISKANVNLAEDNVPVPARTLNNSRAYEAVAKNLDSTVRFTFAWVLSPCYKASFKSATFKSSVSSPVKWDEESVTSIKLYVN